MTTPYTFRSYIKFIFRSIFKRFYENERKVVPITEKSKYNIILTFDAKDVTKCELSIDPELNDIFKCYPDTNIRIGDIYINKELAISQVVITTKSKSTTLN